jgi:glycosyltransferase involved in cell wall biosynthesis
MPAARSTPAVARSLASVLEQSLKDVEVLVGDETGDAAAAVEQADDARVHYQRNARPLGFAGNHEALLARARGRFVAFLHDDDHWDPSYLEQAVLRLEASPQAGFALTAHREAPSGASAPHPPSGCHAQPLTLLLDPRYRFLPSATLARRQALHDVRSPWPRLSCGDMVVYLDAAQAGWGVAIVDQVLVSYARHAGQISSDEARFREDLAQLFELYRFDEPAAERLRRRRIADARLSLARTHLKAGAPADVRASVEQARAAQRSARTALEGAALLALSERPGLLRGVLSGWYAVRGVPRTAGGAGAG